MNFANIMAGAKLALLALAHQAEENIVGESMGPQRKAFVKAQLVALLTRAGAYGKRFLGISFDGFIDAALDGLIDWAAAQVKAGFTALEKL